MHVDPEYLRRHYASLSDEALLAVDRADLVEIAQQCYDRELSQRKLAPVQEAPRVNESRPIPRPSSPPIEHAGAKPAWLEDATETYSYVVLSGGTAGSDAADARNLLEVAGIPCYLDLVEIPQEKSRYPEPTHRWRLMVPGLLNLRATGVLQRNIYNPEFEATWKAQMEALTDEELREMSPEVAFCGLFDRIERVTRAYNEELVRRKLAPTSGRVGKTNGHE